MCVKSSPPSDNSSSMYTDRWVLKVAYSFVTNGWSKSPIAKRSDLQSGMERGR